MDVIPFNCSKLRFWCPLLVSEGALLDKREEMAVYLLQLPYSYCF